MRSSVQSSQLARRSSPARRLPSGGSRPPSQGPGAGVGHTTRPQRRDPLPLGSAAASRGSGPTPPQLPAPRGATRREATPGRERSGNRQRPPLVPTLRHSPLHCCCCCRRRRHRFRSLRRNSSRRAPIASPLPASARADDTRGRSPPPARDRADPARGHYVTSGLGFPRRLPLPPRSWTGRALTLAPRLPSLPTFEVSKGHRDREENGRQTGVHMNGIGSGKCRM